MAIDYRKLKHYLPGRARQRAALADAALAEQSYDARLASEQRHFSEHRPADELPEIYQYWSNTFLRPRLVRAGFDGPLEMFRAHLVDSYDESTSKVRRFLSIGSGDCQTEIALAEQLVAQGRTDFVFECFELNADLVARGNGLAVDRGVSAQIAIVQVDANDWSPSHEYDGVVANSSLHHIQNLEGVFDGIATSLLPTGTFLTSDTIGRNGHMRWPEALDIVEEYWQELPDRYRFNCQLRRQEREFVNWDCSGEGFEGIRAQDILPLLIQRFDFDFFAAFANIVDPFIDRTFGHNFDSSREWDRDFVDRIEARDRAEIRCGRIKPTHIVAAMCSGRPGKNIVMDGLTPQFSVRHPSRRPRPLGSSRKVDATVVALPEADEAEQAPAALVDEREIEIRVFPAVPQCGDYMVARISVTGASPVSTQDRARADAIAIEVKAQGTLHIAAAETALELGLGQFAAGEVQLSARMAGLTTEKTVGVSARAPRHGITMPLLDYSDLWWNPSEPGWGVSIHQHPNGQLVAFWLGYDDACNPTWLSLHPGGWITERVFEGPVYRHRGPGGAKPYDPSGVVAMVAGTGSLTFRTWKAATLRWELADGRLVKDIDRMEF